MNEEERRRARRIAESMSPESVIDRNDHAERILNVVRKALGIAPRDLGSDLLDRARESSRPVPEKEESP